MNWENQVFQILQTSLSVKRQGQYGAYLMGKELAKGQINNLITEIIAKLIDDIPDDIHYFSDITQVTMTARSIKQQLKNKWL